MSIHGNHSEIRVAVVAHLQKDCSLDLETSQEVEKGIFNWALQWADLKSFAKSWKCAMFATTYVGKAKSVLANLDPRSPTLGNIRLVDRLKEGEFGPRDIPFMKPHHIFPERWKTVLDQKMQRDEYIHNAKPAAMTNQFKCGRCKKNECSHHELQLRSCDEPATQFITCLNCGNRWRMG